MNGRMLYILVGALALGCVVLAVMFYQERQKSGVSIQIGGKDGLKIEGK